MVGETKVGTRRLSLVVALVGLSMLAQALAAAFTPVLLRDSPLLLLALDAGNHNVLLTTSKVGLVAMLVVVTLRRLARAFIYFVAGQWYGDTAIAWVKRRSRRGGRLIGVVEPLFARYSKLVVWLYSTPFICALAGAEGMPSWQFIVLHISRTLSVVGVLRVVADAAAGPLRSLVTFSDRHAEWLTVAFVAVTALVLIAEYRHRHGGGWIHLALHHPHRGPTRDESKIMHE